MKKILDHFENVIYEVPEGVTLKDAIEKAVNDGVSFMGANLEGINFDGVSLRGANFNNSNLQGCSFVGVGLLNANFNGASLNYVNFEDADLSMTRFKSADLEEVRFRNACIARADFSMARIRYANFYNASTKDTNMSGANIYSSDIEDMDLGGVNFQGTIVGFFNNLDKEELYVRKYLLNEDYSFLKKYGWLIEAQGQGRPTKWDSTWEHLFVCVKETDQGPLSAEPDTTGEGDPANTSNPEVKSGGLSDTPMSTANILVNRGKRYGSFEGHAAISQALQKVVADGFTNREDGKTIEDMMPSQREALFMILHKVARIVNGDFNYDDSWRDIAGYATLVTNALEGKKHD